MTGEQINIILSSVPQINLVYSMTSYILYIVGKWVPTNLPILTSGFFRPKRFCGCDALKKTFVRRMKRRLRQTLKIYVGKYTYSTDKWCLISFVRY